MKGREGSPGWDSTRLIWHPGSWQTIRLPISTFLNLARLRIRPQMSRTSQLMSSKRRAGVRAGVCETIRVAHGYKTSLMSCYVWAVWHSADGCYYLSLALSRTPLEGKKFFVYFCVCVSMSFLICTPLCRCTLMYTNLHMFHACHTAYLNAVLQQVFYCVHVWHFIIASLFAQCSAICNTSLDYEAWVEWLPHHAVFIHPSMWGNTCCSGWI